MMKNSDLFKQQLLINLNYIFFAKLVSQIIYIEILIEKIIIDIARRSIYADLLKLMCSYEYEDKNDEKLKQYFLVHLN